MVKVILFDWDGTIVDNSKQWFNSFNKMRNELGLNDASFDDFMETAPHFFRKKSLDGIELRSDMMKRASEIWLKNYEKISNDMQLHNGIKEFLKRLRNEGYKIGVVTGGDGRRIKKEVERFELSENFSVIITRDDNVEEKPDPGKLLTACEKLGIKPHECVYIGDMDIDILAAKNCGMKAIAVTWGTHNEDLFKNVKAEHIANSFDQLYEKIKFL